MRHVDPDSALANTMDTAERSFRLNVLRLGEEEREEQVDERIRVEADALGMDLTDPPSAREAVPPKDSISQAFLLRSTRRSDSIDSRTSQSTGITSNYSEVSRDVGAHGRRPSRTSLSFRDYDSFLSRGRPEGRHSLSFSPATTASRSSFSLPLTSPSSPPKKPFRHLRGLSLLIRRSDGTSSSRDRCPHCPRDAFSHNRARHPLVCGHRLCTQGLRETVHSATASGNAAVPSCCGIPLPGRLVECVITKEEQSAVLTRLEQWDEATSITPSMESERGPLPATSRPSAGARTISRDSKVDSMTPRRGHDSVMEEHSQSPSLRDLQLQYDELNERFAVWANNQLDTLHAVHVEMRKAMAARHEAVVDDLVEHHLTDMADAEDKQVKAEGDMREMHAREERDNATALKHMEAFCSGTYSSGQAHDRSVTDQDLSELEKTRALRDAMPWRHENAINVLRGEQSRRMKMRAQRQEREEQDLRKNLRKEELELERTCTSEVQVLEQLISDKRKAVWRRHEMEKAILVAKESSQGSESGTEAATGCAEVKTPQEEDSKISTTAMNPAMQICIGTTSPDH